MALIVGMAGPSTWADEEKPLGYVSLIEGVLEFPGLNAMPTIYGEFFKHKELAIGANVSLGTILKTVDLRLGYGLHDSAIFGTQKWETVGFGPSISSDKLGFEPIPTIKELILFGWIQFDFKAGGLAIGWRL